jgi:hypothetical protein
LAGTLERIPIGRKNRGLNDRRSVGAEALLHCEPQRLLSRQIGPEQLGADLVDRSSSGDRLAPNDPNVIVELAVADAKRQRSDRADGQRSIRLEQYSGETAVDDSNLNFARQYRERIAAVPKRGIVGLVFHGFQASSVEPCDRRSALGVCVQRLQPQPVPHRSIRNDRAAFRNPRRRPDQTLSAQNLNADFLPYDSRCATDRNQVAARGGLHYHVAQNAQHTLGGGLNRESRVASTSEHAFPR